MGVFDRLPVPLRDLALMLVAGLVAWGLSDLVPAMEGHPLAASLLGVVLTQVSLWLLPLTRLYGVGSQGGAVVDESGH